MQLSTPHPHPHLTGRSLEPFGWQLQVAVCREPSCRSGHCLLITGRSPTCCAVQRLGCEGLKTKLKTHPIRAHVPQASFLPHPPMASLHDSLFPVSPMPGLGRSHPPICSKMPPPPHPGAERAAPLWVRGGEGMLSLPCPLARTGFQP